MFTIYSADVTGNPGNCSYPHKHVILDADSMKAAISHDYVCAEYRNNYRNGDNFIGSDCLPVDCDNDHTEDPAGWKTPEDVMEAFPGVTFAIHYSRYNMREKNGKPARPKFHVLFPIDYVTDAALYSDMKKLVNSIFPYFDTKALDAARFFFGTSAADVALYPGRMKLTEFLEEDAFDDDGDGVKERTVYEIMMNYQAAGDMGGGGYLRLMQFDEAAHEIRCVNYSPYLNDYDWLDEPHPPEKDHRYEMDEKSESFTLKMPWA